MESYKGVCADGDFLKRRLNLLGKVFPIPITLEPGEHLRDAILRAVLLNCQSSTATVAALSKSHTFRQLSAFKSIADILEIQRLLDVLGISARSEEVQAILKKPGTISRSHVSFFGQDIRRTHITTYRRVSPTALQFRCYQRAIWSIAPIAFDYGAKELLIDHCPSCTTRLDWRGTAGPAYCSQCAYDLRQAPRSRLDFTDDEAVRYVVGTIDPLISDETFRAYRAPLSAFASRGEQFQFAARLAVCREIVTGEPDAVSSPWETLQVVARAMLGWPSGVFELFEQSPSGSEETALRTSYARLLYDRTLSPNITEEIRRYFRRSKQQSAIMLSRQVDKDCSSSDELNLWEPGKRKQPGAAISAIVRNRGIANHPEALVNVARDIRSVRDVARILGLPIPDVLEVYQAGFLNELRSDLAPAGIDHDASPHPVSLFRILSPTTERGTAGLPLPISRFALDIEFNGRWSVIFSAIAAGELIVRHVGTKKRGIVSSLISDSYALVQELTAKSSPSPFRDVTLTSAEVGLACGRGMHLGRDLVRYRAVGSSLTPAALSTFRREFVFASELGHLLHIHGMSPINVGPVLRGAGVRRYHVGPLVVWKRSEAIQCLCLSA